MAELTKTIFVNSPILLVAQKAIMVFEFEILTIPCIN